MYCNSCLKQIPVSEITYCKECGVPLHKSCSNHCLECGADMCNDCYAENRFRCSDCITENKTLRTVRRSYLKQYEDCPYSLYLQLIEGITPPMSSYAELGIIVHELIEKMQNNQIDAYGARVELLNRVEEWNISTEDEYSVIPLNLLNVGNKCIDVFATMLLPMLNDDFKTEYKIEFSLRENLPTVNCTLDRISFVNGDIHIHDWKTGKPMAGKQLVTDLQPPVYIYGVYQEFGILPKTFTLHYLNAEKNITYQHTEGMIYTVKTARRSYTLDVEVAMERVAQILENIQKNKFAIIEDKEHLWRCEKMCWFHSSGVCEDSITTVWRRQTEEYEKAS